MTDFGNIPSSHYQPSYNLGHQPSQPSLAPGVLQAPGSGIETPQTTNVFMASRAQTFTQGFPSSTPGTAQQFWQRQALKGPTDPMVIHERPQEYYQQPRPYSTNQASRNIESFFRGKGKGKTQPRGPSLTTNPTLKRNRARPTQTFSRLSDKEKTQVYFNLYDSNLELKKSHKRLDENVKLLTAQLNKIARQAKFQRSLIQGYTNQDFRSQMMTAAKGYDQIKYENQELKGLLKDLTESIKTGQVFDKHSRSHIGPLLKKYNLNPQVLHGNVSYLIKRPSPRQPSPEVPQTQIRPDFTHQLQVQQQIVESLKEELENQRKNYNQERARVLELESKLKLLEIQGPGEYMQRLNELQMQNRKLDQQLRDALRNPLAGDNERQISSLREKASSYQAQIATLKHQISLLISQKDVLKQKNIELTVLAKSRDNTFLELDQMMKKMGERDITEFLRQLGIMKLRGEQPAWSKIDFLQRGTLMPDDIPSLKRECQRLKLQKGQLAAQLQKVQSLLTLRNQQDKQTRTLQQLEVQQLKMQLKVAQGRAQQLARLADFRANRVIQLQSNHRLNVYDESNRIIATRNQISLADYDAAATEFQETDTQMGAGENILDLWLGQGEFYPATLSNLLQEHLPAEHNFVSFVSVDFFNHNTQTTSLCESYRPKYHIHISFKVTADDFFVEYLGKEYIYLEVHMTRGEIQYSIAHGKISLKDLLQRHGPVADANTRTGVIQSICNYVSAYDGKTVVGSQRFKLRMRHPLSEAIRWYREKQEVIELSNPKIYAMDTIYKDDTVKPKDRTLVISVFRCLGLASGVHPGHLRPFVYFQVFTQPQSFSHVAIGPDPIFDMTFTFQVKMTPAFRKYLDTQNLEVIVIDDNAPVREGGYDIIGIAHVPLSSLLLDSSAQGTYSLFNQQGMNTGGISLKVGWRDSLADSIGYGSPQTDIWQKELYGRISRALADRGLTMDSSFNIFDQDQDGLISADQFRNTLLITLRLPFSEQEIQMLLNTLQLIDGGIPRTLFRQIFAGYLHHESLIAQPTQEVSWEETIIEKVKKRIREKNLDIWKAFQAFDQNKDGWISRAQFQRTFKSMQFGLSDNEIQRLMRFFDPHNYGKIDYRSFCQKIQGEKRRMSRKGTIIYDPENIIKKVSEFIKQAKISLQDAFSVFDQNKDGKIQRQEFWKVFQNMKLAITNQELEALWNSLHKDMQGCLRYHQFCQKFETPPVVQTQRSMSNIRQFLQNNLKSRNINPADTFRAYDKNNNGLLSRNEFRQAVQSWGFQLNSRQVQALLDAADFNKDGQINLTEFCQFLVPTQGAIGLFKRMLKNSRISPPDLFQMFDRDRDGFISREEFTTILKNFRIPMTSFQLTQLFQFVDKSGDNRINYKEFIELLKDPVTSRSSQHQLSARTPVQFQSRIPSQQSKLHTPTPDVLQEVVRAITKSGIDLHSAFKKFDKNNDDQISRQEFIQVFQEMDLGLSTREIDALLRRIDTSGDNRISYQEFRELFRKYGVEVRTQSLTESGFVAGRKKLRNTHELMTMLQKFMQSNNISLATAFTRVFDQNKDSWVSKDELKRGFNRVLEYPLTDIEADNLMKEICVRGQTRFSFNMLKDLASKHFDFQRLDSSRVLSGPSPEGFTRPENVEGFNRPR